MKMILSSIALLSFIVVFAKNNLHKEPKPDLIIKATQFRLVAADKKIYFKAEIFNIGDAPCTINGVFTVQTYLSTDDNIGNDAPSAGRFVSEIFTLQAGSSKMLNDEYYISYNTNTILQTNPYCIIEIRHPLPDLESIYDNNKSIYKHGFPRKKGEGVSNQPGDIPTQQANRFIDLHFSINNIVSQIKTDEATGKQTKEYTYTATIKNIGTYDAVLDLERPVSFQYRAVPSCQDTSGNNAAARPVNQHVAYTIRPGKSLVLTDRKANKPLGATTAIFIELLYAGEDKNRYNNIACIPD